MNAPSQARRSANDEIEEARPREAIGFLREMRPVRDLVKIIATAKAASVEKFHSAHPLNRAHYAFLDSAALCSEAFEDIVSSVCRFQGLERSDLPELGELVAELAS